MTSRITRAIALLACSSACAAFAQSTPNATSGATNPAAQITVSADIVAKCKVTSAAQQTLGFGMVDPSSIDNVSAAPVTVSFNCTRGVPFKAYVGTQQVQTGADLPGMKMSNGTEDLPYKLHTELSQTTGRGFGPDTGINLVLTASMVAADYQNASASHYETTVPVDIQP